jgi:hypothetical protein
MRTVGIATSSATTIDSGPARVKIFIGGRVVFATEGELLVETTLRGKEIQTSATTPCSWGLRHLRSLIRRPAADSIIASTDTITSTDERMSADAI